MNTRMRPLGAVALAAGIVALSLMPFDSTTAEVAQPTPAGRLGSCDGTITSTLSAAQIRLCDPLGVSMVAEPDCAKRPVHVVYIQIDKAFEAAWMDDTSVASLAELIRREDDLELKVGVVHYNSMSVRRMLNMTDRLASARGPLSQPPYGHDPFGDVEGAAREALNMLRQERDSGDLDGLEPIEIIIFFASTKNIYPEQGQRMVSAASMIKREDVLLIAGCPESHPDYCTFTPRMATGRQYYTEAFDRRLPPVLGGELEKAIDQNGGLRRLTLSASLPDGLAYVDGSADRSPSTVEQSGGRTNLVWIWDRLRVVEPQTVTFQARPLSEGVWPLSGSVNVLDSEGRSRSANMNPVAVTVAGDCAVDTPTPTATPSPIPPSDTPTQPPPSPTTPPTATATRAPRPLYLPIAIWERCDVIEQRADVALVVDTSSSMAGQKLAAAKAAAADFVDMMQLGASGNQVAVVRFDRQAELVQELSADRARVQAALAGLTSRFGTFIDLGVDAARQELLSTRARPGNSKVIVLLTDGLNNGGPAPALQAAERVGEAGITLYAIGLGDDVDAVTLRAMAGHADRYFWAPQPGQLRSIYARVAYDLPCPASSVWPYRRD